jgi:hypothetical protein
MFSLSVSGPELVAALKMLGKVAKRQDAALAALSFAGGRLTMTVGGATVSAAATGEWAGTVEMPASFLLGLAKLPPAAAETVTVRFEGGRLHLPNASVGANLSVADVPRIDLPLGTPLCGVLALPLRHTAEEIARSGLADRLREAEEKRDRHLARAAEVLKSLGVDGSDLRAFYGEWLRKKSGV